VSALYFRSKRKLWSRAIIGYLVIILFIASPILSAAIAGIIANSHGCELNEGNVHPCIIGGTDYGGFLYNLLVFGWFFMGSIPLGIVGFIVWTRKVRDGSRFLNRGAWYALADLENVTTKEFDGRVYLEAEVADEGKRKRLRIFFKDINEQRKFINRRGVYIGGLLKDDSNDTVLVLYNSIVTSK
jgi:hypothetical protein